MLRLQVNNGGHHAHWSDLFEHPAYPGATPALKEHGVASVNNSSNTNGNNSIHRKKFGLGFVCARFLCFFLMYIQYFP